MKNLKPMTDFVLSQNGYLTDCFKRSHNYANFIKQPNELWMFVPCDEDGEILEKPVNYEDWFNWYNSLPDDCNKGFYLCEEYQKAKERCLFAKLNVMKIHDFYFIERDNKSLFCIGLDNLKTVEDLVKYDLQLTQTAINIIGL